MRDLYSPSTASFFPAASLWSSLPITDHNRPLLIKCAPLSPIKQTFCPPAVKKSSIKNDPKSIHYVEYHTSCWGAKFRSTHRDGEHIQEKSHNKYSEPDYWCWLIFWSAPLRLKKRNKVSLEIMELEVKMLNYFGLEVHISATTVFWGFYPFTFQDLIANFSLWLHFSLHKFWELIWC